MDIILKKPWDLKFSARLMLFARSNMSELYNISKDEFEGRSWAKGEKGKDETLAELLKIYDYHFKLISVTRPG